MSDFIFLGSKITADGDCSHEIKRHLLLGRKVMTNLDSIFKSRDITLPTKVCLVKAMVFPMVIGHLMWRVDSLEKTDAGRDWGQEEKGTTEDEMAGWHHQLDGLEFEWTPGAGAGQGGLVCCDSRGRKESDTTERLNWTGTGLHIWIKLKNSLYLPEKEAVLNLSWNWVINYGICFSTAHWKEYFRFTG